MRTLLVLALIMMVPVAAYAQDKIIVIGDDGTVSEVEMRAAPSAKPKEKEAAPAPAPAKAEPAVKPAKKPPAQKQAEKKPAAKKAATQPKKSASTEKKKTPAKQKEAKRSAPAATPDSGYDAAQPPAAPSRQRLGPYMTPEDAIRIALDVAPPARTVNAYPVNFKGLHAYEVVFRTEDGDSHVYVDRESGKIVK